MPRIYSSIPIEIRFWKFINKTPTCWIWTGCTNSFGHGRIRKHPFTYYSHRISYEIHYGKIPEGLFVCHHCDNPSCVRPDHLFLGTQLDNLRDCKSKKRNNFGEKVPNHKLTWKSVDEMRELILKDNPTTAFLSRKYGVHPRTIRNVRNKDTWNR